MDWINDIVSYFQKDPLRILALLGGSGGIGYWISLYRNRIRLQVRIIDLGLFNRQSEHACIRLEVENLGNTPTSLKPIVSLKGFIPRVMTKYDNVKRFYKYTIQSPDRSLSPHVPKTFNAICRVDDDERPFLWYMTYVFKPTRGRECRIYVQSADGKILTRVKYFIEMIRFRISGKVPI
ncbi:MAG: hypothetical protein HY957_04945 [Nitrospirae bacterium]|nr:hypothetical protein [Nitrospirota bacterium]